MAYSIDSCLGSEFFYAEGEPYDRNTHAVDSKGRPISVWSAICMALEDDKERARIESWLEWDCHMPATYKKYFMPGEKIPITPDVVLDAIMKVNTCGDLRVPVDVWIDDCGWCTLDVWDGPEKKEED